MLLGSYGLHFNSNFAFLSKENDDLSKSINEKAYKRLIKRI